MYYFPFEANFINGIEIAAGFCRQTMPFSPTARLCSLGFLFLFLVSVERQLFDSFPVNTSAAEERAELAAETQPKNKIKQPAPQNIIKNIVLAWNRGDSATIARLFLSDGVLVMPTGSIIQSRAEIQKVIDKERQGRLKDTFLKNTVDDVSLVDANTAVVKGKYQLDGMKILGVGASPEGSYVLRQKKQQGRWMIAKAEISRKKSD